MAAVMGFVDYWNKKVRKFTIFDVKLVQGAAMAFVLIIAKLFPQILSVSVWWFVAFAVMFALRPMYAMWFKNDR